MRNRIIFSFLLVVLISSLGGAFAFLHVRNTNAMLNRLISLHQLESLRQQLLRSIQTVQTDLYSVHTTFGNKPDYIINNFSIIEQAAKKCTSCHHTPETARKISDIQTLIREYQKALDFYITASATPEQISKNKLEAASIGNNLLDKTEEMSLVASVKLKTLTAEAMQKVKRVTTILIVTMLLALLLGIIIALYLSRIITRPIDILLDATRKITAGELGFVIDDSDTTEFGELARHFNEMNRTLQSGYEKLEQEILEHKKSEEALRESEERFALAAHGANDGLWDWDLRHNVIFYSSRWKAMLGYSEHDVGNLPEEWLDRIHSDDRPELEARIAAHINGHNSHFEHEFRIRHSDGEYRWMLTRGIAVRNTSGVTYRMAGSQTDISANKLATEQLVHNAFHDSLTDLPNRSLFTDRLQHQITTSARREKKNYAVLFLDMDRFKIVNDSLGHLAGDKLLISVGLKLVECIRPGDTVARLGGDEFSILLVDISDLKDAVDVADRIHHILAAPFTIEGHEVYTAVSIGIAAGSDQYERAEQVLRDADIAMYEAKKRGTGSSEIFDARMHASILDRNTLESELHGVLDHQQLTMVYQPIVDLHSHSLVGFEALVRWNHPTRGIVYPMEFIPLAEETGLIMKIGDWILREACAELNRLQCRFPSQPPLKMSINISGKQFSQENLADMIADILRAADVVPHTLAIEITESMLMENIDVAIATMNRLRDMGVHIHIDDFGTGYSSLSYLHSLPIDALKIDRTFIQKLTANGENQEIILSIMSLAKSLKFEVIAEGVELTHQLEQMKGLDCRLGQGYLFSRPMKPEAIESWINTEKDRLKPGKSDPD
ncbi:MAG TPA: EAL domain-containing protein [Desulfuromonadales bacterium]|nr:EAL domain-containing protein [Desulfuromonadales bacterium]